MGEGPGPWLSCGPLGFSGWAHLTEVDPDEEVQGEIHLRLEVVPGTRACRLTLLCAGGQVSHGELGRAPGTREARRGC